MGGHLRYCGLLQLGEQLCGGTLKILWPPTTGGTTGGFRKCSLPLPNTPLRHLAIFQVNALVHTIKYECGVSSVLTLDMLSKRGRRTKRMNPIWAEDFVTLSRSMNGATGSPSSFSRSLCWKYSSRRRSSQGSATSAGRTSLLMSQHLRTIIFSCVGRRVKGRRKRKC